MLRQLAYNTAKAIKVEYSYTDLIKFLKIVNIECIGTDFKEVNYIEDLESNVPLFTKDGILYKWAHKSIQDYFAAEYISSSPDKHKIIELIYKSNKDNYLNILDFLYELEPELFRRIVVLNLVSNFIDYCDKSFDKYNNGVKKALIRERQAINYGVSFGIFCCDERIDFEDAEEIFKEHISDFNYRTITRSNLENKVVFRFFGANFNQEIINILGKKSEPLFLEPKGLDKEKIDLSIISETPLILDDNPDNIANQLDLFEKVNKIVMSYRYSSRTSAKLYLLDYNKCIKLKETIEKEIKAKKNDALDGI